MDDNSTATVFRDAVMLALLGFVAMVVLLIAHINPPTAREDAKSPGTVTVEISWPADSPSDVDVWVLGPGDKPVGYSRKSGKVFDLLRDDLGHLNDLTPLNAEFAFSRGAPAGEYTVNVHLFSHHGATLPIAVHVAVSVHHHNGAAPDIIATRVVALTRIGEEITVIRFELNDRQRLVAGSIHALPRPLRARP